MSNQLYFEYKVMLSKLKEFKEQRKLTYQEIGDAIGVTKSHIYRVFNDMETSPSLNMVVKLARFMEIPLYSLFIPSEAMIRKDFAEKLSLELEKRQLNLQDLAERSQISELRLKELAQGQDSPSATEQDQLHSLLQIQPAGEAEHMQVKYNLLSMLLSDLGMNDGQAKNVLEYVEESLQK